MLTDSHTIMIAKSDLFNLRLVMIILSPKKTINTINREYASSQNEYPETDEPFPQVLERLDRITQDILVGHGNSLRFLRMKI